MFPTSTILFVTAPDSWWIRSFISLHGADGMPFAGVLLIYYKNTNFRKPGALLHTRTLATCFQLRCNPQRSGLDS